MLRNTGIFSEMTLLVTINIEEPRQVQKQDMERTRGARAVEKQGKGGPAPATRASPGARKAMDMCKS